MTKENKYPLKKIIKKLFRLLLFGYKSSMKLKMDQSLYSDHLSILIKKRRRFKMKYKNPYGIDVLQQNERENKKRLERLESYIKQIADDLKDMELKLEQFEALGK
ncbi:hypothetical protein Gferi_15085 [Geosporobacter ferrireducens]|uniref:Uncharacterized protein n=2 Tax=Geosporobacter ferrireducens TaxID=1424294 RepID=A0A1D8GIV8_9FIRM|nr:hypothetical protein Gferi_15085 [Geosporobacter ferrireducens]